MPINNPICFIGFGAWGGAVAIHLARHGVKSIAAWEYLPELRQTIQTTGRHPSLGDLTLVPKTIKIVDTLEQLPITSKSIVIIAVASSHTENTLRQIPAPRVARAWVILSKGLDPNSLKFLSESVESVIGTKRGPIFAISGPTIAKELVAGAATTAVLAGPKGTLKNHLATIFNRANFIIQQSDDLIGVQTGGAMKNIYALGYGILDGLNAPNNTKATFLTTALNEMALMAKTLGGQVSSVYGPAGLGDLLTTSLSSNSRNSKLGRLLAQGNSLENSQRQIGMVTEGVEACRLFLRMAQKNKIKLPLAQIIQEALKAPTKSRQLLLG